MKDVLLAITLIVLVFVIAIGAGLGLTYANSAWNCRAWHSATGESTNVVAGSCMVHNPRTGRWELYETYVRDQHVGLHSDG